ncbi:MAG: uroporphyrinogen-III C-methyltransferase [Micromonosporaceae bacterium]|nr:uroporphyrinogen-III C-methyltransferase [Micromonosporaceae bacterium]
MTEPYLMGLRLEGLPVLFVGGGAVATRRIPALLAAGALVTVVARGATPVLIGLANAGRIKLCLRPFQPSDLDGCWLVHVAVDDPQAARGISEAARERRVFCVRADDRKAATAWTPATTRHGRVTVGVTAGGDPRRAARLRDAVREGLIAGTLDRGPAQLPQSAGVVLVGAGPGDPELITVRGRHLLARADVVVADHLAPALLLDELRPEVELIDAAKLPYGPARAQEEINRILIGRARAGRFVVRLKGGDPYVFGRGGEEAAACAAAGIPVTVVPGVTSAIAVPSAAGIPVTHRGVAHEFTVVTGHVPPGDPDSLVDWEALGRLRGTVCVLMGLRHLALIAAALLAAGRPDETPAAVIQEGTRGTQRQVLGTLSTIAAEAERAGLRPPAVIVVGDVVAGVSICDS